MDTVKMREAREALNKALNKQARADAAHEEWLEIRDEVENRRVSADDAQDEADCAMEDARKAMETALDKDGDK